MWVFSDIGFFSVVAHRDIGGHYLVRARDREHLEALLDEHWPRLWPIPSIQDTPYADYGVRITVSREQLDHLAARLVEGIDYDNFKSFVERERPGWRRYIGLLHDIWHQARQALAGRAAGDRP